MIPWQELDRVELPGQAGTLTLRQRGSEFSIRTTETELMNSRLHGSEDALAELSYSRLNQKEDLRILIGGLGMGYTLAAALAKSDSKTLITISELIPAVVKWNRQHLGHLAGRPLDDPRVSIQEEDVVETIRRKKLFWNAILLDVDNGPNGLIQKANDRLYSISGLKASFAALCPGGILAVWSSGPDEGFTARLNRCGFLTETLSVRARKTGKGARHTVWLAARPERRR